MVKKVANSRGHGYEGVDPAAECNIHKTSKFAVWDAPGVSQPPVKPKPTPATSASVSAGVMKQKQNNNGKFFAASTPGPDEGTSWEGKGLPPTAKLSCTCGEVVISLPGPPVNRLECCCMDCKKAIHWCHSTLNGPPLTTAYVDLAYFANCLQVEQGGEFLDVFMIKEGYNTSRVIATCCGTALMGDHPFYHAQKIVTYIPPAKVVLTKNCEMMSAQRRIFEADNTDEEKATIPKFERPPTKADPVQIDLKQWKSKHPQYTTIQGLIATIGPLQYMDPEYKGKEPQFNKTLRQAMAAGN